jgi:hypothetical protein
MNCLQLYKCLRNAGRTILRYTKIYVDFKQAYDSINHEKLYKIMYDDGIPGKLG